jgi:hypothetical protein
MHLSNPLVLLPEFGSRDLARLRLAGLYAALSFASSNICFASKSTIFPNLSQSFLRHYPEFGLPNFYIQQT